MLHATGAIGSWKAHAEHVLARKKGRGNWYRDRKARAGKIEREYGFEAEDEASKADRVAKTAVNS